MPYAICMGARLKDLGAVKVEFSCFKGIENPTDIHGCWGTWLPSWPLLVKRKQLIVTPNEFSFFLSKYFFLLLLKTILAETRLPNQQKPTFSSVWCPWCLKTVPLRAFATVQWLLNICNIYYIGWKCKIYITLLLSEHSNIHLEEKSAVCQDWLHLLECSESTGRNVFPREVNRNCFPLNEICYVARGSMMYSVHCTRELRLVQRDLVWESPPNIHSSDFHFLVILQKQHYCNQLFNFWHNSVSE